MVISGIWIGVWIPELCIAFGFNLSFYPYSSNKSVTMVADHLDINGDRDDSLMRICNAIIQFALITHNSRN